MPKARHKKYSQNGQSIVELVVALGIFAIVASSIAWLFLSSVSLSERHAELTAARYLGQEGIEAVRSIRNRAWSELIYNRSGLNMINNEWGLAGEGTMEQIGRFQREIVFEPVYRDNENKLATVDLPFASEDQMSKIVTSIVYWKTPEGNDSHIEYSTLLSNWPGR